MRRTSVKLKAETKIEYVEVDLGNGKRVRVAKRPGIQDMLSLYALAKKSKRSDQPQPKQAGCFLL